jgi:hypothetical protein
VGKKQEMSDGQCKLEWEKWTTRGQHTTTGYHRSLKNDRTAKKKSATPEPANGELKFRL